MNNKIIFTHDTVEACTIAQVASITTQLTKLLNDGDLSDHASSITFDSEGFDQVLEITL